jgi:hypothetical protein
MTGGIFEAMDQREQRALAEQLSNGSDFVDFDTALEIVQWRPEEARRILQTRAEMKMRQEERARSRKRLMRVIREEFG